MSKRVALYDGITRCGHKRLVMTTRPSNSCMHLDNRSQIVRAKEFTENCLVLNMLSEMLLRAAAEPLRNLSAHHRKSKAAVLSLPTMRVSTFLFTLPVADVHVVASSFQFYGQKP